MTSGFAAVVAKVLAALKVPDDALSPELFRQGYEAALSDVRATVPAEVTNALTTALEPLRALADDWKRIADELPVTNEHNYTRIGIETCRTSLLAAIPEALGAAEVSQ